MGKSIFLSYRSPQSLLAKLTQWETAPDRFHMKLAYNHLKKNGWSPWMDIFDIRAGSDWQVAIERAIASCDVFVVYVPAYPSAEVQKEVEMAKSYHKPILPVSVGVMNRDRWMLEELGLANIQVCDIGKSLGIWTIGPIIESALSQMLA